MKHHVILLVLGLDACGGDPVHDKLVASLGPETTSPGPTHRPGEPCLACHDGTGPASTKLAMGGTIYLQQGKPDPLAGAEVDLLDLAGNVVCTTTTNSAGNFYWAANACAVPMPAKAKISRMTSDPMAPDVAEMVTRIGRQTSCATCHQGDMLGPTNVEKIYLLTSDQPTGP